VDGPLQRPVNGEFGDPLVNAVRAFQRQNKSKQTGVLNPYERAALIALVRPLQEQVGWHVLNDVSTGARVGLPAKLVPHASAGKAGSLWSSAQGQVRIETFRIAAPDTTLAGVFEQQKTEPVERKIESQALRPDSFTIIGMQGLKKFHVRGYARGNEVRGITILYDQAVDGMLDPLVLPVANSFQPFASNTSVAQDNATSRRKIEYGTGLVVSSAGHIVTDLQVAEACQVVIIPGLGNAEQLAADRDNDLALLRVYGAEDRSVGVAWRCCEGSRSYARRHRRPAIAGRQWRDLHRDRKTYQHDLDQRNRDHAQSDARHRLFRRGRARQGRTVLRHGGIENSRGRRHDGGRTEGYDRDCGDDPNIH
jgi:peptidoglycan hydrolase-like protein with peptidoglycan-binding domain